MKFKIQTAKYNPRKFSKENRKALKKSMEEFSDISGITVNEKTGNIVSGNHRWEELETKHGPLELVHAAEDRYLIMTSKNKFTGFLARLVNWPLTKEKQANIIANSSNVTGEWSTELQDVLQDINQDTEKALMDELRLTEMVIDLTSNDDDLDLSKDKKREKTEKTKEEDDGLEDDEDKTKNSEVREIVSTIKITLPAEHKEEVMEELLRILSKKHYYEETTIY